MPLTKITSSMLASGASGSGGSSGKNYISTYNNGTCNGDFESGSDSGWTVCSVATGFTNGVPIGALSIPAASINITKSLSSSPIAGQYSLQAIFGSSSVNQGLITDVFTIDTEDQAKVLTFKFYYQVTTNASTNSNFSGTSANTFLVAIYDVTNSTLLGSPTWIQPAGLYSMTQSSGAGIATGTFQTTSNSTQYRFAIFCANSINNNMTVVFDDFTVGPLTAPIGAPMTDWQSYTPTTSGLGTITSVSMFWRRVGSSVEIMGNLTTGDVTTSPSEARIGLPSGLVSTSTISTIQQAGTVVLGTTTSSYRNLLIETSKTYLTVGVAATTSQLAKQNGNTFANTVVLSFQASVPIQGWSANVQMSNDTDTRVVAAYVTGDAPSVTAGNPIIFPTVRYDTHGSYSTSTGFYTVPVSGFYKVTGFVNGSASVMYISVYKGASSYADIGYINAGGVATLAGTVQCNAGDTLSIRPSATYDAAANCAIQIERLSGPSAIAASETVAASYAKNNGQVLNYGVITFIDYPNKEFDTHSIYSAPTGAYSAASGSWATTQPTWTIPTSGKYDITACITWADGTAGQLGYKRIYVFQNGVQVKSIAHGKTSGGAYESGILINCLLNCVAGDYIQIKIQHQEITGGTTRTVATDNTVNFLSIKKIGL